MAELATQGQGRALADPAESQSGNLLAQIIAAASNPDVDPAKMETMSNLALRLQAHEQQQQFNRDLNLAILEMPVISKDGKIEIRKEGRLIQSTPFARFEDIDRIVRPIAARHNLTYSFRPGGNLKEGLTVECIIRHANGHVENGGPLPLPLENSGSKNGVQGVGSSITYGKRYALCAAFSIVTEGLDNDGHGKHSEVSLPHEREALVLGEAERAAAAGGYAAYFATQSPRDRAWLVQNGHHARLGGAALPAPTPSPKTAPAAAEQAAGAPQDVVAWVGKYLGNILKCTTTDDLMEIQQAQMARLASVREKFPDQWQRIVDGHAAAQERLQ